MHNIFPLESSKDRTTTFTSDHIVFSFSSPYTVFMDNFSEVTSKPPF